MTKAIVAMVIVLVAAPIIAIAQSSLEGRAVTPEQAAKAITPDGIEAHMQFLADDSARRPGNGYAWA